MESDQQDQFNLLIVDDEKKDISSMIRLFSRWRYNIHTATDGKSALEVLLCHSIDLMILDLKMPGMGGMEVLRRTRELSPETKVIIQTGNGGVNEAVEAIKLGASEFLQKGDSAVILRLRVNKIHELWKLNFENRRLSRVVCPVFTYEPLAGDCTHIQRLKEMIVRVAATDATVLIQGESGTGKELIARAIHHHSTRADQPLVAVDCAAINEAVIESELFGHTKGSFTGADSATQGLIRSADRGTIFLDEIGELSLSMQVKFLRTLQERVVRPVGSTRSFPVDIRIVAATNHNLLGEVNSSQFRQDLYYRLSSVTLVSPPLRERGEDIILLAQKILTTTAPGKDTVLTSTAQEALKNYSWPGNVRELENTLTGALVFAKPGRIDIDDLPQPVSGCAPRDENILPENSVTSGTLAAYELLAIKNALKEADNNRRLAAQILDISEATLYRKVKQFNL